MRLKTTDMKYFFLLLNGPSLVQFDMKGKKITGKLADKYILKKIK